MNANNRTIAFQGDVAQEAMARAWKDWAQIDGTR